MLFSGLVFSRMETHKGREGGMHRCAALFCVLAFVVGADQVGTCCWDSADAVPSRLANV